MLLNIQQARTHWCPLARQAGVTNRDYGNAASVNRDSPEHYGAENCNCIASSCMAWRWAAASPEEGPRQGFCGAFGEPRP